MIGPLKDNTARCVFYKYKVDNIIETLKDNTGVYSI